MGGWFNAPAGNFAIVDDTPTCAGPTLVFPDAGSGTSDAGPGDAGTADAGNGLECTPDEWDAILTLNSRNQTES